MTQAGANWYYAIGQERHGPIDITALRQLLASGQIMANTLVWTDGMPNWVAASTHPDLAIAAQQNPQMMYGGGAATGAGAGVGGGYVSPGGMLQYYTAESQVVFGGFWLRFCAAFLDGLILLIPNYGLQFGIRAAFGLDLLRDWSGDPAMETLSFALVFLTQTTLGWLYGALQESSHYQATLGKRACGLIVTDMSGQRISFARATGRHFGKIVSWLTIFIGFIMAGFTQRKQALHDIMAGTLVIRK